MIKDEVTVPSKSEWNFPLIVVPKTLDASGKGKWRICIDFRKLNEVTIGDSYPLPNIRDILDKFYPTKWKVVTYINLEPTRELWKQTRTHQGKILSSARKSKIKIGITTQTASLLTNTHSEKINISTT
jgi:hypothetical protein